MIDLSHFPSNIQYFLYFLPYTFSFWKNTGLLHLFFFFLLSSSPDSLMYISVSEKEGQREGKGKRERLGTWQIARDKRSVEGNLLIPVCSQMVKVLLNPLYLWLKPVTHSLIQEWYRQKSVSGGTSTSVKSYYPCNFSLMGRVVEHCNGRERRQAKLSAKYVFFFIQFLLVLVHPWTFSFVEVIVESGKQGDYYFEISISRSSRINDNEGSVFLISTSFILQLEILWSSKSPQCNL